jgi:class 3 adenylate cyclase
VQASPAEAKPPRVVYVPEGVSRPPVVLEPVGSTRPALTQPEIPRPEHALPTQPAFADGARDGETLGEARPLTVPELPLAEPPQAPLAEAPVVAAVPEAAVLAAPEPRARAEAAPRTEEPTPVQLADVVHTLPPPVADAPSPEREAAAQVAAEPVQTHALREQEITRPFRWVPAVEGVEVEVEVSFDEHEVEAPLSRSEGLMHRAVDRAAALLGADRVAIHLHSGSSWTGPTGAPVPRPVPQVIQSAAQAHPAGLHLDAEYWRVFARSDWGPWLQGICDALVIPLEAQGTLLVGATRRAEPFSKADLWLLQGLAMQVTQLLAEAHAPAGRVRLDLDAWCRGERFVERAALALLQDAEPRTSEVSMLCVGVRSLLASLQGLPPGQVLRTLNRTLEDISAVVHAYGGLIERVQGDGVVAIWGLEPADCDAHHALWAGAAVVKRLAALGVAGATVGVHTDNMLLGRLRFGAQHHFAAVSHSLSHCWTLGQLAPGRLVTSRATLSRAGTQLPGRPEAMPAHLVEPGFPFAPFVLANDERRLLSP